jgi:hypothetical protein
VLVVVTESTESPRGRVAGTANELGSPESAADGEETRSGSAKDGNVSVNADVSLEVHPRCGLEGFHGRLCCRIACCCFLVFPSHNGWRDFHNTIIDHFAFQRKSRRSSGRVYAVAIFEHVRPKFVRKEAPEAM